MLAQPVGGFTLRQALVDVPPGTNMGPASAVCPLMPLEQPNSWPVRPHGFGPLRIVMCRVFGPAPATSRRRKSEFCSRFYGCHVCRMRI